ncbi:hypothetical protein D3C76_565270 [compost metagenome]
MVALAGDQTQTKAHVGLDAEGRGVELSDGYRGMLGLIPVNLGRFVGVTEDTAPGPSFKWCGLLTPGPLEKAIPDHAQQDGDAHWAHESCRAIDSSSNAKSGTKSAK